MNCLSECGRMLVVTWATAVLGADAIGPPSADVRERFALDPFYEKCVVVETMPVVASARVADAAVLEAAFLIRQMVGRRPDVLRAMAAAGTRFAVMSEDEFTTDIPEHSDLEPAAYWDRRARGLGATPVRPAVSCGEENLLCYPGDPYSTENILIHEFAHAIHEMGLAHVDPTFDARLRDAYRAAMESGRWEGKYAATNRMEYWAEGVQSWFDTNRSEDADHNHVDTRQELREYDEPLAALCSEIFGDGAWRYVRPRDRRAGDPGRNHLVGFDPKLLPQFAWPKRVLDAWEADRARREGDRRLDGETTAQWLLRTAAAGDAAAQVRLGWHYREGDEVEQSDHAAAYWFRQAVELDSADACDQLGWLYKLGRGVDRDDAEAVRLFRRSAEGGHAQGMYNLALMLLDGRGAAPDGTEASRWLRRAAALSHAAAGRKLEQLRDTTDRTGPRNQPKER